MGLDKTDWSVLGIAAMAFALAIGVILGTEIARVNWQKQCIARGYAEYRLGVENKPVWAWKEVQQ